VSYGIRKRLSVYKQKLPELIAEKASSSLFGTKMLSVCSAHMKTLYGRVMRSLASTTLSSEENRKRRTVQTSPDTLACHATLSPQIVAGGPLVDISLV